MIIYKYLNENGARDTLKSGKVLLKCPTEYNDPFDCYFYFDKEDKDNAYRLFLNYHLFLALYNQMVAREKGLDSVKTYQKYWKKSDILKVQKETKENNEYVFQQSIDTLPEYIYRALNKKPIELKKMFNKMLNGLPDKLRGMVIASCFGQTYDSILMWAHYAHNHAGACIEYEIDDKDFKEVKYSEELQKFDITKALIVIFGHEFLNKEIDAEKPEYSFLLDPLLTKSDIWKYEDEIRFAYSKNKPREGISHEDDKYLLKISPKRVFLGLRAEKGFVKEIKELANGIPVLKMKQLKNKYGLVAEKI